MSNANSPFLNTAFDRLRFECFSSHDLPAAGRKAGTHYFDKDTLKFFDAKLHRAVMSPCRLAIAFLDSVKCTASGANLPREYRTKVLTAWGEILDADAAGVSFPEKEHAKRRECGKAATLKYAEREFEKLVETPGWEIGALHFSIAQAYRAKAREFRGTAELLTLAHQPAGTAQSVASVSERAAGLGWQMLQTPDGVFRSMFLYDATGKQLAALTGYGANEGHAKNPKWVIFETPREFPELAGLVQSENITRYVGHFRLILGSPLDLQNFKTGADL